MNDNRYLRFISGIGKEKFSQQGNSGKCPFCRPEENSEIIDRDGPIVLVKNKYATLADSFQTVLIETDDCKADIRSYNTEYLRRIITFGIDHWQKFENSGDFRSVVFYKNHGPLSGGTIEHAHMQIVGLEKIDYRANLRDEFFTGIEILKNENSLVNLSCSPLSSAIEFNIIAMQRDDHFMAECIKILVEYIMTYTESYNLFFYDRKGSIICKIVPRWVSSPYFIGYFLPQITDGLTGIARQAKKFFDAKI